jgi:large subunit ribosomal protein L35
MGKLKLKTHKGTAKRFRLTKKGKIKHGTSGKSHLLTSKESGRKRGMRQAGTIELMKSRQDLKRLLPYGN